MSKINYLGVVVKNAAKKSKMWIIKQRRKLGSKE